MKEICFKVGNDNGNSEQDIIINENLIQQPNVFAKVAKLPNMDEVSKKFVLSNIHQNLIVSLEGGTYYIGEYALKSGQRCRNIDVGIDNNKIESQIVYVNTLAHIAGEAVAESKDFKNIIKVKVDMTTSLPVSYYGKRNANDFADKFLSKKHIVTVYVGNEEANVEIEFTYVKVIPEGVTAVFALQKNENLFEEYNKKHKEKLSAEYFKNARILHVAIGEGTTEFPVTHDVNFDINFIQGTNNGNGHAIDRVIEEFKKEKGLTKLTRQDYSQILLDKSHKYHDLAMELIEPALEDEAEDILKMTEKVIQQANNEIDIVCVYGGGSILMKNALEERLISFCKRAQINLFYVDEKNAVTLEAQGLYNFTNSEIFTTLKNNYIEKNKKQKNEE